MAAAPGERLGPYEIVAQVGRGGMGEVYRARDTKLGREVAITDVAFVDPSGRPQLTSQRARPAATPFRTGWAIDLGIGPRIRGVTWTHDGTSLIIGKHDWTSDIVLMDQK